MLKGDESRRGLGPGLRVMNSSKNEPKGKDQTGQVQNWRPCLRDGRAWACFELADLLLHGVEPLFVLACEVAPETRHLTLVLRIFMGEQGRATVIIGSYESNREEQKCHQRRDHSLDFDLVLSS